MALRYGRAWAPFYGPRKNVDRFANKVCMQKFTIIFDQVFFLLLERR